MRWFISFSVIVSILIIFSNFLLKPESSWINKTFSKIEEKLGKPYVKIKPDNRLLCRSLLDENPSNFFKKSPTKDELIRRYQKLQICKQQEDIKELNRRYRERQTLLGRLGAVSGLIFAFITVIATISITLLGNRWATSKTQAEQSSIEQKRILERNKYNFKLFTALSNDKSGLDRMAASAALQARLSEIQDEKIAENKIWKRTNSTKLTNLQLEEQTIVRVFLSALKISNTSEDSNIFGKSIDTKIVPTENIIANKSIAEGIAIQLNCFVSLERNSKTEVSKANVIKDGNNSLKLRKKSPVSPLKNLDMQTLDLRKVFWGEIKKRDGLVSGRGGLIANGVDFYASNFTEASLRGASLEAATFFQAKLIKTIFRDARLNYANFEGAIVKDCDFKNANICGCDFSKCLIFENNNMKGATTDTDTVIPKDF